LPRSRDCPSNKIGHDRSDGSDIRRWKAIAEASEPVQIGSPGISSDR
jgi:hypothetical protein